MVKKKKTKKNEKITKIRNNDELNEETKEEDNENNNPKNQAKNNLQETQDITKEIKNKGNINSPQIENENIEENLLNYYIEEIKKAIEEDKKDKFIISKEIEENIQKI